MVSKFAYQEDGYFTYLIGNKDALCTMVQGDVIFAVTNEFSIAWRRYSILSIVCILFSLLNLITDIMQIDVKYRILIYFFGVFLYQQK